MILPGYGVATPLPELLDNYRRLIRQLPAAIERHPDALVVRNEAAGLTIVARRDGGVAYLGYIDTRTGDIDFLEPGEPS